MQVAGDDTALMNVCIDFEQEDDGRWIAEIPKLAQLHLGLSR